MVNFNGKFVKVFEGFVFVGVKFFMLLGIMLVVEVDRWFLLDEKNNVIMFGFSGNCIGCGVKGFRYFIEFLSYINLKFVI